MRTGNVQLLVAPAALAIAVVSLGLMVLPNAKAGFAVEDGLLQDYRNRHLVRSGSTEAVPRSTVPAKIESKDDSVGEKKKRLDALVMEAGALIAEIEHLRDQVLRAGGHDPDVELVTARTANLIERFQQAQERSQQRPETVVSQVSTTTPQPARPLLAEPPLASGSVRGEAGLYRLSRTVWNTKAMVKLPKGFVTRREFFRAVLPVGYIAYFKGEGVRFEGVVVDDEVARTWEEWLEWAALSTGTRFNLDYRVARVTYWGVLPAHSSAATRQ